MLRGHKLIDEKFSNTFVYNSMYVYFDAFFFNNI